MVLHATVQQISEQVQRVENTYGGVSMSLKCTIA